MKKIIAILLLSMPAAGALAETELRPKIFVSGRIAVPANPSEFADGYDIGFGSGIGIGVELTQTITILASFNLDYSDLDESRYRADHGIPSGMAVEGGGATTARDPHASVRVKAKGPGHISLQGQLVDLFCYVKEPKQDLVRGHQKCLMECIQKGFPIAFLSGGEVYLLVGGNHVPVGAFVKELPSHYARLTGVLIDDRAWRPALHDAISPVHGQHREEKLTMYRALLYGEVRVSNAILVVNIEEIDS